MALLGLTVVTLTMTTVIIGFGLAVGIACAIPAVLFSLPILWVRAGRRKQDTGEA